MDLYPLWSGLLLTDSLSRDTNSQAELWMRILKKYILWRGIQIARDYGVLFGKSESWLNLRQL